MASIATNTNIDYMNIKQIKHLARQILGTPAVYSLATSKASLVSAIKAK